jgi:cyanate permease
MPADRRLPLWAGRTAALLGILLIALNLRSAVAALSPIVDQISSDVALGPVVLGIIGAAPPVTFAVTGLLAPWLSRKLGLEGGLLLAAAAMVIGHVARSLAPNATMLIIATTVTLAGAGFGNVLLPPVVKRYFPDLCEHCSACARRGAGGHPVRLAGFARGLGGPRCHRPCALGGRDRSAPPRTRPPAPER